MVDRNLEFRPQPPARPEPTVSSDVADDGVVIYTALAEAADYLEDARLSFEKAHDLAVNHSLVPAETRAEVAAAYGRLVHDAGVVAESARVVRRVLDHRLGTVNVCPECGAGSVDYREPWHYAGCPLEAS